MQIKEQVTGTTVQMNLLPFLVLPAKVYLSTDEIHQCYYYNNYEEIKHSSLSSQSYSSPVASQSDWPMKRFCAPPPDEKY